MAGEMFGAPAGIQAAEENRRANVESTLKAQELLGKIAAQPGERALTAAHTDFYSAEAATKLEALNALRAQTKLDADFADYERKAAPIVNAAASQGRIATAEDVDRAGTPEADPNVLRLQNFLSFAESKGVPERLLTPHRKELSTILMQQASANHSNAQALEQTTRAQGLMLEQVASWVSAVQANPAMYPQALAAALNDKNPAIRQAAAKLPPTYDPATIERLRLQGIKAEDQQRLKMKKAEDESQRTLRDAQEKQAKVQTSVAENRARLIGIQADAAAREFGPGSTQTKELKAARIDAIKGTTAAKDAEKFPAAPADAKFYIIGKSYTAPNGKRFTVTGKDAKGEPIGEWLSDRLKKNIAETSGQGD